MPCPPAARGPWMLPSCQGGTPSSALMVGQRGGMTTQTCPSSLPIPNAFPLVHWFTPIGVVNLSEPVRAWVHFAVNLSEPNHPNTATVPSLVGITLGCGPWLASRT
jgi:hypothetical protein